MPVAPRAPPPWAPSAPALAGPSMTPPASLLVAVYRCWFPTSGEPILERASLRLDDTVLRLRLMVQQAASGRIGALISPGHERLRWDARLGAAGLSDRDVVTALREPPARLHATHWAFAALLGDGRVATWGDAGYGGDSSAVRHQLSGGVRSIHATASAFAAVKDLDDGTTVTWGCPGDGGDSSAVQEQLKAGRCARPIGRSRP
ncbi:unnamed protein product [Prorocentrum cordatum]|uniref:Uncharacterized protein n=1 Tax=Prorocentrum cordatum TaxID=2364126 RepID=A0ABN9PEK1_9DINO|nr:unnamed protein product [Polarella glacialis]